MKFNQEQIKKLEENPNVLQVLDDKIFYTPEFKTKVVGQTPTDNNDFVINSNKMCVFGAPFKIKFKQTKAQTLCSQRVWALTFNY